MFRNNGLRQQAFSGTCLPGWGVGCGRALFPSLSGNSFAPHTQSWGRRASPQQISAKSSLAFLCTSLSHLSGPGKVPVPNLPMQLPLLPSKKWAFLRNSELRPQYFYHVPSPAYQSRGRGGTVGKTKQERGQRRKGGKMKKTLNVTLTSIQITSSHPRNNPNERGLFPLL